MSIKTRNTLKGLFADGKILTDTMLAHLIDSYLHLSDDGSTKIKALLAADKLNASHIDTDAVWAAFTNAIGAGCNFGQVGFTSAEIITIPAGTTLEFEAYLSSVTPASKLIWGVFLDSGWYVIDSGSNFYHEFNTAGSYDFTVTAKDANNTTIATLLIEDWVVVTSSTPTVTSLTKAQIEIPSTDLASNIIECEIVGNDITCEVPAGTDLTQLIPRLLYNGTITTSDHSDFKNGAIVDLSSPMNFTIDASDSEAGELDFTLTVTEA